MTPDLVCVVADKNIEAALDALLKHRMHSIGARSISSEIHVHPQRDPGCYHNGPEFLEALVGRSTSRGLLVFDQSWDGNPNANAHLTECDVAKRLPRTGNFGVVVIDPELEVWAWSDSPHVGRVLNWPDESQPLRNHLQNVGLWLPGQPKPSDPKRALEHILAKTRVPRSSSLYRSLAQSVGLARCQDPSFARFRSALARWFPVS